MPKGKRALKKKVGDDTVALIDRQLDAIAADKPESKNAGPLFFEDRSGVSDRDDHKNRRARIASSLAQKGGWGRGVIDREYDDEDNRKLAERRLMLQEIRSSKDKVYTVSGEKRRRSGHEFELKKKKIVARRKRRRGENGAIEKNDGEEKEKMDMDGEESGSDDDDNNMDTEITNKAIEIAAGTGSKGWEGGEGEVYDLWSNNNNNNSSTEKSTGKQAVSGQRLRAKYAKALKKYTKEGKWIDHNKSEKEKNEEEDEEQNGNNDEEEMNEKFYKKSKKTASDMIETKPSLLVGMHDGMSYNPLPSAQQALVDEIGSRIYMEERKKHMMAEKVKAIHQAEQESTKSLLNPDQTIEGLDDNDDDDDDHQQDGPRISRPPVENQKLTRTERNKLEKKKHRQAEEEKKLLEKKQSKMVKQLPSLLKEIDQEKKSIEEKTAINKGDDKLLSNRLGPNKLSLSLPIDAPLSDELRGSIRELRPSTTILRDTFERFQDRRLIETRSKNHYHRRYKMKQVVRNSHRENNNNNAADKGATFR